MWILPFNRVINVDSQQFSMYYQDLFNGHVVWNDPYIKEFIPYAADIVVPREQQSHERCHKLIIFTSSLFRHTTRSCSWKGERTRDVTKWFAFFKQLTATWMQYRRNKKQIWVYNKSIIIYDDQWNIKINFPSVNDIELGLRPLSISFTSGKLILIFHVIIYNN